MTDVRARADVAVTWYALDAIRRRTGSATCSQCGMLAIHHDLRVLP